jgi:hypothetical protein
MSMRSCHVVFGIVNFARKLNVKYGMHAAKTCSAFGMGESGVLGARGREGEGGGGSGLRSVQALRGPAMPFSHECSTKFNKIVMSASV